MPGGPAGLTAARGPQGPEGPEGPQGEQGPPGEGGGGGAAFYDFVGSNTGVLAFTALGMIPLPAAGVVSNFRCYLNTGDRDTAIGVNLNKIIGTPAGTISLTSPDTEDNADILMTYATHGSNDETLVCDAGDVIQVAASTPGSGTNQIWLLGWSFEFTAS